MLGGRDEGIAAFYRTKIRPKMTFRILEIGPLSPHDPWAQSPTVWALIISWTRKYLKSDQYSTSDNTLHSIVSVCSAAIATCMFVACILGHVIKCKNHPIWVRKVSCCQKFHQDSGSAFRIFLSSLRSQRQPISSWASSATTESSVRERRRRYYTDFTH